MNQDRRFSDSAAFLNVALNREDRSSVFRRTPNSQPLLVILSSMILPHLRSILAMEVIELST